MPKSTSYLDDNPPPSGGFFISAYHGFLISLMLFGFNEFKIIRTSKFIAYTENAHTKKPHLLRGRTYLYAEKVKTFVYLEMVNTLFNSNTASLLLSM